MVEAIRALLVIAGILLGDLVVVVNKDRARTTPILDLGLRARLGPAFAVILPMGFEVLRQEEIGGERMKVALAHQHHPGGIGRNHGADDLGPRLLIWLAPLSHAEAPRPCAPCRA